MRIHFLVLAHYEPELLWRLCTRLLEASEAAVTVQWDCAFDSPVPPPGLDITVRPTRDPCGWGNYGQLDALVDSLFDLERSDFDWLVTLSGQDYPLRPLPELEAFLAESQHQLFLDEEESFVEAPPRRDEWTFVQDRYLRRYSWFPQRSWSRLPPRLQRALSGAAKVTAQTLSRSGRVRIQRRPRGFSPGVGVAVREGPFTPERPCRKGSDWFVMSRAVYDDLLLETRRSPDLLAYFRRTYIPTESYVHTILLPKWETTNAGSNLHFVRFTPNGAHPDTLTADDWDELVESGDFFARKFDARAAALVDRIDRELLDKS
jgi:hypothetical protein